MILVRLLLFLSLAAIGAALLMWLIKRDRRYLRFIGLTLKFTLLVLLAILLWFAAERVLAPVLAQLLRRRYHRPRARRDQRVSAAFSGPSGSRSASSNSGAASRLSH